MLAAVLGASCAGVAVERSGNGSCPTLRTVPFDELRVDGEPVQTEVFGELWGARWTGTWFEARDAGDGQVAINRIRFGFSQGNALLHEPQVEEVVRVQRATGLDSDALALPSECADSLPDVRRQTTAEIAPLASSSDWLCAWTLGTYASAPRMHVPLQENVLSVPWSIDGGVWWRQREVPSGAVVTSGAIIREFTFVPVGTGSVGVGVSRSLSGDPAEVTPDLERTRTGSASISLLRDGRALAVFSEDVVAADDRLEFRRTADATTETARFEREGGVLVSGVWDLPPAAAQRAGTDELASAPAACVFERSIDAAGTSFVDRVGQLVCEHHLQGGRVASTTCAGGGFRLEATTEWDDVTTVTRFEEQWVNEEPVAGEVVTEHPGGRIARQVFSSGSRRVEWEFSY